MGTETRRSPEELPIACKLTDEEQHKRREELSRELFSGRKGTRELDDGYEFVFAGGADWAEKLVRFVVYERECCPFFSFEVLFEPGGGPISLRVRGPEGTKRFVDEEGFVGGWAEESLRGGREQGHGPTRLLTALVHGLVLAFGLILALAPKMSSSSARGRSSRVCCGRCRWCSPRR